jgi:hypothetical protein
MARQAIITSDDISELRIDVGKGFRVYFGQHGDTVVLLIGGTKKTQAKDIRAAKRYCFALWCNRTLRTLPPTPFPGFESPLAQEARSGAGKRILQNQDGDRPSGTYDRSCRTRLASPGLIFARRFANVKDGR